ncbi:MAG TPA: N-(5'-phosphoribosyl)anthranilate isomerase, partial [Alphaproteobacteria bacterium]|nr:N-(5'-phosphoribosyl)anthranilate isomerase [Alphaproteobacteria bacterium]
MPTWIKICGTTSVADALASVEVGADALGFIFAPSPRRITPEMAQEIAARLPANIERVGVFVNETPARIRA